ncbi:MAG: CRISPR-associated endonuclease Cas6 [candidate division WOR-3 bacterium]
MELELAKLVIEFDGKITPSVVHKIRGFIGGLIPEDILLHHHMNNGKLLYRYPKVQYKHFHGKLMIIGIQDGIDSLVKLFQYLKEIQIEKTCRKIVLKELERYEAPFGASHNLIAYEFITPWVALNEENYKKYIKTDLPIKKKNLLEKILVGNVISLSKGVGYTVQERLHCNILSFSETNVTLKSQKLVGFYAKFLINFYIPEFLGLGKSVSRGYGVVSPCNS